jgi:hypothetical protein
MTLFTSATSTGSSGGLTTAAVSQLSSDSNLVNGTFRAEINITVASALATIDATLATIKTPESKPLSENSPNSSERFALPLPASYTSAIRTRDVDLPSVAVTVTRRLEGSVLCIYDDGIFDAKLTNLTDDSLDVTGEFCVEDLSDDDRSLLAPGAIFYFTEGREHKSGGRIRRASDVRFLRLGRWSKEEITDLLEQAKQRRAALGFDDEPG